MRDKHHNLFYSYNLDNELIENNMTRAFIVTLRTVSNAAKSYVLSRLLKSLSTLDSTFKFDNVEFALQDRIPIGKEQIRKIPHKFLIALTANDVISEFEKYEDPDLFESVMTSPGIKPDAWIYDKSAEPRYCFLIECKPSGSVLSADQIIAYDKHFFGASSHKEAKGRLIILNWTDIIEVCKRLIDCGLSVNDQEARIIGDFLEYLSYCGIVSFEGIHLESIGSIPAFSFSLPCSFYFDKLSGLPNYSFSSHIMFRLNSIPDKPDYKLLLRQMEE